MVLLKCKVCKKPVRRYDIGAPTGITISVPGAESQDAERRRQIALRALSERLSKTETEPLNKQWPSMNDPEEEEAVEITNKDNDEGDLMSVNETVKDVQGAPVWYNLNLHLNKIEEELPFLISWVFGVEQALRQGLGSC